MTVFTPVPRRPGMPFLYRYQLYSDFDEEPDLNLKKNHILHLMNGQFTCFQIADATLLPFVQVRRFLGQLRHYGVVDFKEQTPLAQRYPTAEEAQIPTFNEDIFSHASSLGNRR